MTTYHNILMEFIVSISTFMFFHVFLLSMNKLETELFAKMHSELF